MIGPAKSGIVSRIGNGRHVILDSNTPGDSNRLARWTWLFRALTVFAVLEIGALAYNIAATPDAPGIVNQGLLPRIVLGLIVGPSIILFAALLLWRAPRNPAGGFLLILGMTEVGAQFVFDLGLPVHSALLFELFILLASGVGAPCVGLLLLTFPTGTIYPSHWAPWVKGAAIVKFMGVALEIVSSPGPVGIFMLPSNPLFIPMLAPFQPLIMLTIGARGILLPLMTLAGVISLGLRYRDAGTRERQQIKWVLWAPAIGVLGGIVTLALLVSGVEWAWPYGALTFFSAAQLTLLVSLTIAILRYHLFDIDRLINRTLVYGVLSVILVAVYGILVGSFSVLFQTSGNIWVSLVATALIAIGFQHVRDRVQSGVNRLLYGDRDEPYAALSHLGQRLETTMASDTVLPTIVETVAQSLKLPYVALELIPDELGGKPAAVFPSTAAEPPTDLVRLPLVYQNESIGHLILAPRSPAESFTAADRRLLEDFARQAGIAAHAVQLTRDLQRSRERLVMAREEERRRIRRDLHDGLGPALAAQMLKVGSARALFAQDSGAADELLAELEHDIETALADIRRLVYDLRPPALDELGLLTAVRQTAAQYSSPRKDEPALSICVEANEPLPPLPAAVEVAAFRITQEALTNVVHHAHARTCRVHIHCGDKLLVEISDDGSGLPTDHPAGVGLTSMRERAEELGGTCVVERRDGSGTRVRVELPLSTEG